MRVYRIKTSSVSFFEFMKMLKGVNKKERKEIKKYLFKNIFRLDHLEYGRETHRRSYKIFLKGGEKKIWNLFKSDY